MDCQRGSASGKEITLDWVVSKSINNEWGGIWAKILDDKKESAKQQTGAWIWGARA